LFTKSQGGKILIIIIYVDDLIFTINDRTMCDKFKSSMVLDFDMSNFEKMKDLFEIVFK